MASSAPSANSGGSKRASKRRAKEAPSNDVLHATPDQDSSFGLPGVLKAGFRNESVDAEIPTRVTTIRHRIRTIRHRNVALRFGNAAIRCRNVAIRDGFWAIRPRAKGPTARSIPAWGIAPGKAPTSPKRAESPSYLPPPHPSDHQSAASHALRITALFTHSTQRKLANTFPSLYYRKY